CLCVLIRAFVRLADNALAGITPDLVTSLSVGAMIVLLI
ncbi:hypothetical protein LCGC14_1130190, partial [marine sediment metagenome]